MTQGARNADHLATLMRAAQAGEGRVYAQLLAELVPPLRNVVRAKRRFRRRGEYRGRYRDPEELSRAIRRLPPNGHVLVPNNPAARNYGANPHVGYDASGPGPGFTTERCRRSLSLLSSEFRLRPDDGGRILTSSRSRSDTIR
jgi:hypothetical protein